MTRHRRPLYFNEDARSYQSKGFVSAKSAHAFHEQLKHYQPSPLVPLPGVAKDIGVKAVYAKDETNRLGLSAVNILGTSWAIFRAMAARLKLPEDAGIEAVKAGLSKEPIPLYTAVEGHHALAVARMGSLLSTPVQIHVPAHTSTETIALLRIENATVVQSSESADDSLQEAQSASKKNNGVLVQEEGTKGYHNIPQVGGSVIPLDCVNSLWTEC